LERGNLATQDIVTAGIDSANDDDGVCVTVGGAANDIIEITTTQLDGATVATVTLITTGGATASITA